MSATDLRDRFVGAMLGTFAGDALGMPVENWSARKIAQTFGRLDRFRGARLWLRGYALVYGGIYDPVHVVGPAPLAEGTYTDDTQMMIGVAESLVERPEFDGADMARRFVSKFDPRRGYGPGTVKAIRALRQGAAWDEVGTKLFGGTGSFGNGAAMRSAPIGLLFHDLPERLHDVAIRAAEITHAHPLGKQGAVLIARAVGSCVAAPQCEEFDPPRFIHCLRDELPVDAEVFGVKLDAVEQLLNGSPSTEAAADALGNSATAQGSVPAALYAFLSHRESLEESVVYAVSLGGDTDTIGAMTGAIAGAYHGARAIPPQWFDAMENGADGRDYVRSLAERLFGVWSAEHADRDDPAQP